DEAIAHLQHLIDIEPQFDQVRTFLGKAWLQKGQPERALEQFNARRSTAPGSFADLACAYAQAGRLEEAHAEIARLQQLSEAGFGMGSALATAYPQLGALPTACRWLKHALEDQSQLVGFLLVAPALDALRGEPAYAEALRDLNSG